MPVSRSPHQPLFYTRMSTLAWAAVTVVTYTTAFMLTKAFTAAPDPGGSAVVTAVCTSASVISFCITWIGGVVLAMRSRSIWFTLLAVLPIPLINSVLVALLARPAPPQHPGGDA